MNNETKATIIMLICAFAAVGVYLMICDTLRNEPAIIHPHGPMADDGTVRPDGPVFCNRSVVFADGKFTTVFEGEIVEVIPVPAYEKCPRGKRVFLGNYLKVVDSTGTVRLHWMYECEDTAWNRTPIVPDCGTPDSPGLR